MLKTYCKKWRKKFRNLLEESENILRPQQLFMSIPSAQYFDDTRGRSETLWFDSLLNYNYFHTGDGVVMRKWKLFAMFAVSFGQFSSQHNFTLPDNVSFWSKLGVFLRPQIWSFFTHSSTLSMNVFSPRSQWTLHRVSHDTFMCVHIGKFLLIVVAVECALTRAESKP